MAQEIDLKKVASITSDHIEAAQMTLTADYFLEEYNRFRELIGQKSTTVEFMDRAFEALTYVYFNVRVEEYERVETAYIALTDEVTRRAVYMAAREAQ